MSRARKRAARKRAARFGARYGLHPPRGGFYLADLRPSPPAPTLAAWPPGWTDLGAVAE